MKEQRFIPFRVTNKTGIEEGFAIQVDCPTICQGKLRGTNYPEDCPLATLKKKDFAGHKPTEKQIQQIKVDESIPITPEFLALVKEAFG